jgi:hypothetical protein
MKMTSLSLHDVCILQKSFSLGSSLDLRTHSYIYVCCPTTRLMPILSFYGIMINITKTLSMCWRILPETSVKNIYFSL